MIKGIQSFNGKHGCHKCTIVGEYSHISRTTIFQEIDCLPRNDEDFRKKLYGKHHQKDSALLSLPIDIVKTFPVADSMHLIDLGVMKRLLIGWRDGNFIKKDTKWRASDITKVNSFLDTCITPNEIHRSVRNLKDLCHWKASELRTFLFYFSIVILQEVLNNDAMTHFLSLYCAVTICSNENYFNFLPLAKDLLKHFVTNYKLFYGVDHRTSNIHNLTHVVEEVQQFGPLQDFNAYPFENKLYIIKNMLRHGNKPLSQVAKRLGECGDLELNNIAKKPHKDFPYVKENSKTHKLVLHCKDFIVSEKISNRYFMTLKEEIMEISSITVQENDRIVINCYKINNKDDVFQYPIRSSYLNIFKYNFTTNAKTKCSCFPEDIKCKLVASEFNSDRYVIPLLHTI